MEKLKNLFELKDRKWSPDGPVTKSFQTYLTILKLVPGNFWDWVRTKNKFRFWEDFWSSSCAISDFQKSFFNAWAIFLTTYQSQSKYSRIDLQKKNFMAPFYRFNCLKATEQLRGESLLFTTKSPGVPGT